MAFLPPPPPPPIHSTPSPSEPPITTQTISHTRRRRTATFISFPPRTALLSQVQIIGRKKLPESIIATAFTPLENTRVTAAQVTYAIASLNAWYKSNDYPCSHIHPLKAPSVFSSILVLAATEPLLTSFTLQPIDSSNNPIPNAPPPITRPATVLRALGLTLQSVFHWTPSGFASLLALGLFDHVDAHVTQTTTTSVSLTLRIRERPTRRIEPGLGITGTGNIYGDLTFLDSNFQGRAQRLSIDCQRRLDPGRASATLRFDDPRVGASPALSWTFRAFRAATARPGRVTRVMPVIGGPDPRAPQADVPDGDRDGVRAELSWRPGRNAWQLTAAPGVEKVVDGGAVQMVLSGAVAHVSRRPVDLPGGGHLARVEAGVGSVFGARSFAKVVGRAAQYFTVGKGSMAVAVEGGVGSDAIPVWERRALGGARDVRGYAWGELGSFRRFGLARAELRVPLGWKETLDAELAEVAGEVGPVGKDGVVRKSTGNLVSRKMFDTLQGLTGVVFADAATGGAGDGVVGASYGIGVRVGGVVSVDWTRTFDGRKSRLHFGLIDRSL